MNITNGAKGYRVYAGRVIVLNMPAGVVKWEIVRVSDTALRTQRVEVKGESGVVSHIAMTDLMEGLRTRLLTMRLKADGETFSPPAMTDSLTCVPNYVVGATSSPVTGEMGTSPAISS